MNEKNLLYQLNRNIESKGAPYSRNSSILDLSNSNNNTTDLSSSSTSSNQGRSYRDSVLGNNKPMMTNKPSRNSMFISPTMDLKTFELPLYQKQHSTSLTSLILRYNNDSSTIVSTALMRKVESPPHQPQ